MGTPAERRAPVSMEKVLNMVWDRKNGMYVYKHHKTIRYRLNRFEARLIFKLRAGASYVVKNVKRPLLIGLLAIALVVMFIGKVGYLSGKSVQRRLVPRLLTWL